MNSEQIAQLHFAILSANLPNDQQIVNGIFESFAHIGETLANRFFLIGLRLCILNMKPTAHSSLLHHLHTQMVRAHTRFHTLNVSVNILLSTLSFRFSPALFLRWLSFSLFSFAQPLSRLLSSLVARSFSLALRH